ncbi:meiosis-specific protein MEI4-like isoform X2 [Dysidea avara]|uniref:meiosis-specific protein MEI4-like isoform X2 n=1 Tax=Dysidea avara TaxID=196820 RepID=UPI003326CAAD
MMRSNSEVSSCTLFMEKKQFFPYQINIMKLALALVIIRRKPRGVSAKEYATRLAVSFNQVQEDWKEKCAKAETELIFVRQKLVEMKLEREVESDIEPFSHMDTMSQPFTSQSQGYCSYSQQQWQAQGGSMVYNDDDCRSQSVEEIIRCHTAFMNKMSILANIKKQLTGVIHCDTKVIIQDTFVATVKALQNQEIDFAALPASMITDAVQSIINCRDEMAKCVWQLQNKLIASLLNNFITDLWNKEAVEGLCTVILSLSSLPELVEKSVLSLVKYITMCGKMLSDSYRDVTVLKPDVLDCAAKAFYLIESILKKCQPYQLESLHDMLQQEGGVLNLSLDQYPLFTYYMWRLSAILSSHK